MKNKILSFIIGVLVGAIVATASYYFYAKYNTTNTTINGNGPKMGDMQNMPEPPNGMPGDAAGNETSNSTKSAPPAKPDGENMTNGNNQGEPPAKPDEGNSTSNKTSTKVANTTNTNN